MKNSIHIRGKEIKDVLDLFVYLHPDVSPAMEVRIRHMYKENGGNIGALERELLAMRVDSMVEEDKEHLIGQIGERIVVSELGSDETTRMRAKHNAEAMKRRLYLGRGEKEGD